MTEAAGLMAQDVSRETIAKLEHYAELLRAESARQNLVSAASNRDLWKRHIHDAAQLVPLGQKGSWCDVGSGAGLPGMIIASMLDTPVTLIEPRRLRAEFLRHCVGELALHQVNICQLKAERVVGSFDNITARAVAPLDRLLGMTAHLSHPRTRWILPKGESVKTELDEARRSWQGSFRSVASQTHSRAAIVVAEGLRRKGRA